MVADTNEQALISPVALTRKIVLEHRRWLLGNAGDANEVDACRQYFDRRLGAGRRIEAKECICASINRRRHTEAAKREAAQIDAAATGRPIDPRLVAAATPSNRKPTTDDGRYSRPIKIF